MDVVVEMVTDWLSKKQGAGERKGGWEIFWEQGVFIFWRAEREKGEDRRVSFSEKGVF